MPKATFPTIVLTGFAAALAIGAGLVHAASVDTTPAHGIPAAELEAATVARAAETVFARADLDNDGFLSSEEYVTLSVVTAELARLNGFVTVDYAGGARVAALPAASAWTAAERARIETNAVRDHALFAGDDARLSADEFVEARLEALSLADRNRDGVLNGAELTRFAAIEAQLPARQS